MVVLAAAAAAAVVVVVVAAVVEMVAVVVVGVGIQGFFISALAGVSVEIKIKTAKPHTALAW